VTKKPDDKLAKVVWLDRGWQPTFIGFCPSRKAWNREMKRLGVKDEPYPNDAAGRCTTFDSKGKVCIIVTIREACEKHHSRTEIAGLICHEATHAWQKVREVMGEAEPSIEFEAYSMQAIFQNLYQAWLDTRCPPDMKASNAKTVRSA
jgi:hypothetical protein